MENSATHNLDWPSGLTLFSERGPGLQDVALGVHVVVAHIRHAAVLEAVTIIAEAIVDLGRP